MVIPATVELEALGVGDAVGEDDVVVDVLLLPQAAATAATATSARLTSAAVSTRRPGGRAGEPD
jgi:hypothetical protein